MITRTCEICGGPIPLLAKSTAKICSPECLRAKKRDKKRQRDANKRGGARRCEECGADIPADRRAKTCSDACNAIKYQRYQREFKRLEAIKHPERGEARAERLRQRRQADAEYAAELRAKEKVWRQNRLSDPAQREITRAAARRGWERNKASIMAARAERLAAMTEEQREAWEARAREAWVRYMRRKRAQLEADPDAKRAYLAQQRAWRTARATAQAVTLAAELNKRLERADE